MPAGLSDPGKQVFDALQTYGSISRDQAGDGYHISVDQEVDVLRTANGQLWREQAANDLANIIVPMLRVMTSGATGQHPGGTSFVTYPKNGPGPRLDVGPPPLAALGATSFTPSPNGTIVPPATSITDANGIVWGIGADGEVTINGVDDGASANVVKLEYVNGTIWQQNTAGYWYGKTKPSDAWLPTGGQTADPLAAAASPDNTIVPPAASITDANGHVWAISTDGHVTVDGAITYDNANVVKLAYEGGKVWQNNSAGLWWSKTLPTDTWLPTGGTTVSPIPAVATFTESPQNTGISYVGQTPLIYDSIGETFALTGSGVGSFQILQNGVVDPHVPAKVNQLLYYNHFVYYQDSSNSWYYKPNIASAYTGPVGDPRQATFTESPQEANLNYAGQTPVITNGVGETFALTGTAAGQYQILQNGVVDPNVTPSVYQLLYFNHLIYYQDNTFTWRYKANAAGVYALSPTGDPRFTGVTDTALTADALVVMQTPFTESPQNTNINYAGQTPPIYDRVGDYFGLTGSGPGFYQILQNGAIDTAVLATVKQLVYYNRLVYYQDSANNWYSKPNAASSYVYSAAGDPRITALTGALTDTGITSDALAKIPTPFTESAQNTNLTYVGQTPLIYDRLGETFALTGPSVGHYQILQNGAVDQSVPATVNQLLYYNRLVYYQDSSNSWYYKTNIGALYTYSASGDPRNFFAPTITDTVLTSDALVATATPFTESAQNTSLTFAGQTPLIVDRLGETFGLTGASAGQYQIVQNGAVDSTVPATVVQLLYYNRLFYYKDNTGAWYYKTNIAAFWIYSPTGNPAYVAPTVFNLSDTILTSDALAKISTPFTESLPRTRLAAAGQMPYIYDRVGDYFGLTGPAPGQFQILQNGAIDSAVPGTVIQLLYYNQLVYYEDSSLTWHYKPNAAATYVVSPVGDPTASVFPQLMTDTVYVTDTLVQVTTPADVALPEPVYVAPVPVPVAAATSLGFVAPAQTQPLAPVATVAAAATTTGYQTLLLDPVTWDLVLDANGNIAVASGPYAIAQDAASAIRLFQGEAQYDTSQGIPYFPGILGQQPSPSVLKNAINQAALSVPGVVSVKTYLTTATDRSVTGQVQIVTSDGTTMALTGTLQGAPVAAGSGTPAQDANGNLVVSVV